MNFVIYEYFPNITEMKSKDYAMYDFLVISSGFSFVDEKGKKENTSYLTAYLFLDKYNAKLTIHTGTDPFKTYTSKDNLIKSKNKKSFIVDNEELICVKSYQENILDIYENIEKINKTIKNQLKKMEIFIKENDVLVDHDFMKNFKRGYLELFNNEFLSNLKLNFKDELSELNFKKLKTIVKNQTKSDKKIKI